MTDDRFPDAAQLVPSGCEFVVPFFDVNPVAFAPHPGGDPGQCILEFEIGAGPDQMTGHVALAGAAADQAAMMMAALDRDARVVIWAIPTAFMHPDGYRWLSGFASCIEPPRAAKQKAQ